MLTEFQVVIPTSHVTIFSLADDFEIKQWQIVLLVIGGLVVPGIILVITGIFVYCCRKGELQPGCQCLQCNTIHCLHTLFAKIYSTQTHTDGIRI